MKSLVLVAHGSRRKESNQEVMALVDKIKELNLPGYDCFEASFLELAKPSILDAIQQSIDEGATSIVLLPYFLNSGTHVVNDIPSIMNQAKEKHPDINFQVTTNIGASDLMMDLILSIAGEY